MTKLERACERIQKYTDGYDDLCTHFGVRGSKEFAEDLRLVLAAAKRCAELEQSAGVPRGRALAEAWRAWLASDEGRGCTSMDGNIGPYLSSRLWRAFMAGAALTPHPSKRKRRKTR